MTMTEGMHAIVASGILRHEGADDEYDVSLENTQSCLKRAGDGGDSHTTLARTCALEYFNFKAGAWYAIRSDSDW